MPDPARRVHRATEVLTSTFEKRISKKGDRTVTVHTRRARRHATLLVTCTAAALLLSACGSKATSGDPATSPGTGTTGVAAAQAKITELEKAISSWPQAQPLAEPADVAGKKFTIVPFVDEVPLMHGTAQGFTAALEELGAEVDLCDGAGDPTKVASCMTTAADRGVDAVVTLFIDYDAIGNAVEAVTHKGIPVLIGGQPPSANRPADKLLGYADHSPFTNTGFEYLAYAALAAGGENTSVVAGRMRDSSLTTEFSDTMISKFKEICPTCTISSFDYTVMALKDVPTTVSAALAAQPDTNIVVVPDDGHVAPVLMGVQSAGFADKVKIVAYGADPAGLERIKAGQEATSIGFPVEFEGWRMANSLLQLLGGQPVTPVTDIATRGFTANNIGEVDIKPENYFSSVWYGDESFKDDFRAAWGAK